MDTFDGTGGGGGRHSRDTEDDRLVAVSTEAEVVVFVVAVGLELTGDASVLSKVLVSCTIP